MIENVVTKARAKLQRHVTDIETRTDLTDDQKVSHIIVIFQRSAVLLPSSQFPLPIFSS